MSNIEWTDKTWNPVTGCTKVSPGCKNCYAETVAKRLWATQYPSVTHNLRPTGEFGMPISVERPRRFTDVQCHPDRLEQPLHWRKPRRVFVNSMSDLFNEDVSDEFIDQVFAVMALAKKHTFQILTKRPERMLAYLEAHTDVYEGAPKERHVAVWFAARNKILPGSGKDIYQAVPCPRPGTGPSGVGIRNWPLPNVWLGVSVENQQTADDRIPLLLQTPASVRFLSCEPLLEAVNLTDMTILNHSLDALRGEWCAGDTSCLVSDKGDNAIDWVIVGGESGPKARPCDRRWIYKIQRQCSAAGVPIFIKQLGAKSHIDDTGSFLPFKNRKGGEMQEWPEDLRVREFPAATNE